MQESKRNNSTVFGCLSLFWLLWLFVGAIAWTFHLWRDDTLGRWSIVALVWFLLLALIARSEKKSEKDNLRKVDVVA
jgi:Na+/H+ antiporter NhaD/arsenite permease-like protein